jgi:hypothetical protein
VKRVTLLAVLLFLLVLVPGSADDLENLLKLIQENAFKINITARVIEDNTISVWNMEVSRLTIAGKTVNVKLTDENIIVIAHITPYVDDSDSITLIAQGQVYLTNPDSKNVQYMSTVKSLPVSLGERVLFYPLGYSNEKKNNQFVIELEIQVLPYQAAN